MRQPPCKRIGERLPWVATQNMSIHWLWHTTLTFVERNFSYGIARAYAGHTDHTEPATTTYIKADLQPSPPPSPLPPGSRNPLATTLQELGIRG